MFKPISTYQLNYTISGGGLIILKYNDNSQITIGPLATIDFIASALVLNQSFLQYDETNRTFRCADQSNNLVAFKEGD